MRPVPRCVCPVGLRLARALFDDHGEGGCYYNTNAKVWTPRVLGPRHWQQVVKMLRRPR